MLRTLRLGVTAFVSLFHSTPIKFAVDIPGCVDFIELVATPEEIAWLKQTCPFFDEEYLDYLAKFRFKPEQVHVEFNALENDTERGRLEISAVGPWVETILWEVPLMSCLSEIYFRTADKDWNYDGQEGTAMFYGVGIYRHMSI